VAHAAAGSASNTEHAPGYDWRGYNKDLDGQRYSPLNRIDRSNAGTLKEVCRVEVARRGSFQAGPVVVDGVMYVTAEEQTLAIDPVTCAILWRHVYHRQQNGMVPINRGVAYSNGRLFRGTEDVRVLALDAATGRVLWESIAGDARLAEYIAGAPIAWNGLVIVGTAGSEWAIKGRIMAFDAATGREIWRFSTIPTGQETGAQTWKDTKWAEHGGGGTWSSFALDPVTAELFIPVGNPVPDFAPTDRPGANLFTNSVLVLDARTGALHWWYQLSPNDGMDWDLAAAPLLFRGADHRDRVAAAGKDGFLHVIDRETHALLFKTATTTIDMPLKKPTREGARICPGPGGGTLWNGPAFDPASQTLFVGAMDMCAVVATAPGDTYATGKLLYGGSWTVPKEPPVGWLTAFDANTGAVRWKYKTKAPIVGAVTATAGGIVMTGDNDGNFLVLDSGNGALLKKIPTSGSISGGIVTYLIHGEQYIALTSGNVSRTMFGAVGRPNIVVLRAAAAAASGAAAGTPVERGREVYQHHCLGCHASDGTGIAGFSLKNLKVRMNRDQLIAWIRKPRPPMPRVFPEPLDEGDLRDLDDLATFLGQW
jgi:alcohol dehydrogenase (cytochrome c)